MSATTRRVFFGTAGAGLLGVLAGGERGGGEVLEDGGVLTLRPGDKLVVRMAEHIQINDPDVAKKNIADVLGWDDVVITQGVTGFDVVRRGA